MARTGTRISSRQRRLVGRRHRVRHAQAAQGDISFAIADRRPRRLRVGANPEELMLGAVAACFVNTWAIFLKKLNVGYAEPAVRVSGTLGPDPPAASSCWTRRSPRGCRPPPGRPEGPGREDLSLAEKYCIISKVTKAAMPCP